MSDLVNFIQIDAETDTLTGNLATLTFDIDITGEPVESTNPQAPVYRLYAKSRATAGSRSAASGKRRTRGAANTIRSPSTPALQS
ncbi:DUF736 domain-containing protein [Ochrobactrum oryzae]|nr:DUF736 domain-containing protein [Brucella oryzae]